MVTDNCAGALSYDQEVLAIFRAECLACHNEDDKQGDLDLSTYDAMLDGGASGAVIEPGDPDESHLYRLVAHLEQPSMPPETPMIARESVELIEKWISQGAIKASLDQPQQIAEDTAAPIIPIAKAKSEQTPHFPPRLPRSNHVATDATPAVVALAASPTAPLVAAGGVRQVWLLRTDSSERIGRLIFTGGDVRCLKFSPDGSLLLVGGGYPGASGSVEIWDIEKGKKIFSKDGYLDAVRNTDISSDHQRLAVSTTSSTIDLFDLQTGNRIAKIDAHTDWITDLEFSDDGVLLASADRAGGLHLWDSWTGKKFHALKGHNKSILTLQWTYDSNFISSSGKDGFIRIWSAETGRETQKIKAHEGGVVQHARRADGGWVSGGADNILRVWNPQGKSVGAATPFGDTPTRIAYTPADKRIIVGDYLGSIVTLDEITLTEKKLPSINPGKIEKQIVLKRSQLKAHQRNRFELIEQINAANQKFARSTGDLEDAKDETTKVRGTIDRLTEKILAVRKSVRRIQTELSAAGDSPVATKLIIARKLKQNDLARFIAHRKTEENQLRMKRAHLDVVQADSERQALKIEQLNEELSRTKKLVKASLIALATLIEENAFSTRYDLLFLGRKDAKDDNLSPLARSEDQVNQMP